MLHVLLLPLLIKASKPISSESNNHSMHDATVKFEHNNDIIIVVEITPSVNSNEHQVQEIVDAHPRETAPLIPRPNTLHNGPIRWSVIFFGFILALGLIGFSVSLPWIFPHRLACDNPDNREFVSLWYGRYDNWQAYQFLFELNQPSCIIQPFNETANLVRIRECLAAYFPNIIWDDWKLLTVDGWRYFSPTSPPGYRNCSVLPSPQ